MSDVVLASLLSLASALSVAGLGVVGSIISAGHKRRVDQLEKCLRRHGIEVRDCDEY